jgi:hypothetical protein
MDELGLFTAAWGLSQGHRQSRVVVITSFLDHWSDAAEVEDLETYAKASLKKYRPMAARNEDKKVFSGLL